MESGQVRMPVVVSAHGTVLTGLPIAQDAYFVELPVGNPPPSAPPPGADLPAQERERHVRRESGHHRTIRGMAEDEPWPIGLEADDGWARRRLGHGRHGRDRRRGRGPFALLLDV